MRFLVDEQLPPRLARWIAARGHEAWHVVDLDLLRTRDRRISEVAAERGAVMVTKDSDYRGWRIAVPGLRVLWLRLGDVSNRRLLAALDDAWPQIEASLAGDDDLVIVRSDGAVEGERTVP